MYIKPPEDGATHQAMTVRSQPPPVKHPAGDTRAAERHAAPVRQVEVRPPDSRQPDPKRKLDIHV